MNTKWIIAAVGLPLALGAGAAFAQMQGMPGMQGGGHGMTHGPMATQSTQGDQSASSLAFQAANAKMHKDMDIVFTGDADRDFVRGMVPHHQGAIDMAKIELAFGKDPEVRKLAESIIKAQEDEIAWMNKWLAKTRP